VLTERFAVIRQVDDYRSFTGFGLAQVADDLCNVLVLLVNRVLVVVEEVRVVVRCLAGGRRLERLRTVRVDVIRVVHVREVHDAEEGLLELADVGIHLVGEQVPGAPMSGRRSGRKLALVNFRAPRFFTHSRTLPNIMFWLVQNAVS
jgi:hypothetical protein